MLKSYKSRIEIYIHMARINTLYIAQLTIVVVGIISGDVSSSQNIMASIPHQRMRAGEQDLIRSSRRRIVCEEK